MRPRHFLLIALTFTVVAAIRVAAPSDLATGDQPLQVAYIDDIVQNGAWIVQHLPDGAIAAKPPLYNWVAAVPIAVINARHEVWYKLPSLIAAFLSLLLVYDLTRRLTGADVALVAGLLLATSPLFTKHIYFARTDMLLTLLIIAQVWCGYMSRPVLYWTAAALAMLTKGPIGVVLPLVALSGWWWHRGELRERWRTMRLWSGLALSMLPFLSWFGAALAGEGRPVWDQLIGAETVDRFMPGSTKSKEHRHVFYYVPHLIARMTPASLLALAALPAITWRRTARSDVLLPLFWVAGMLTMLSLVPSKRADRLFPLVPAVCMLAGWAWINRVRGVATLTRILGVASIAIGIALIAGLAGLPTVPLAGAALALAGLAMLVPWPQIQLAGLLASMITGLAVYQFLLRR